MTPVAQEKMVEYYKDLRADDAQGVGRNSYRITVRQLESMIRLSEAIARANCVKDITPEFVKEAYNLLQQSIIHVEKDDVEMDDEDEENQPAEVQADAEAPEQPAEEPAPKKEKTKVTYDKYIKMMNLIVRRLNEDDLAGGQGIERDELIMWYLEQVEEDIATEEQHQEEAELIRKVLKRLKKVRHYQLSSNSRINILWKFVEKQNWRMRCKLMSQRKSSMSCILIATLRTLDWQEKKRKLLIRDHLYSCKVRDILIYYSRSKSLASLSPYQNGFDNTSIMHCMDGLFDIFSLEKL